ncbi:MAG TPA: N-acetylmuramic acid 6-phosphate etherase, partial [Deinococcales bacterium]|nr:N-acetylmuramic acid 6-phosphate etherase [Deinococcales bacterium]
MSAPVTTRLATEQVEERYADLDLLDDRNVLERLLNDQEAGLRAVRTALPALTAAVAAAAQRLERGGRLVYAGAGTSGRLCQLDAAELIPTFSWPAERVVALVAGGRTALFGPVENAEDDTTAAETDCLEARVGADDVVIGVAASGTTPYVRRVLEHAREHGALTIGIANNPGTPVLEGSDHAILLETGAEVLSGSTRMKAGTSQKAALNLLSTAVMVRLGKVYRNLMVDVVATNEKLHHRAVQLTVRATGTTPDAARRHLEESGWNVKTSIAMARLGEGAPEARARIEAAGGRLRPVIGDEGQR